MKASEKLVLLLIFRSLALFKRRKNRKYGTKTGIRGNRIRAYFAHYMEEITMSNKNFSEELYLTAEDLMKAVASGDVAPNSLWEFRHNYFVPQKAYLKAEKGKGHNPLFHFAKEQKRKEIYEGLSLPLQQYNTFYKISQLLGHEWTKYFKLIEAGEVHSVAFIKSFTHQKLGKNPETKAIVGPNLGKCYFANNNNIPVIWHSSENACITYEVDNNGGSRIYLRRNPEEKLLQITTWESNLEPRKPGTKLVADTDHHYYQMPEIGLCTQIHHSQLEILKVQDITLMYNLIEVLKGTDLAVEVMNVYSDLLRAYKDGKVVPPRTRKQYCEEEAKKRKPENSKAKTSKKNESTIVS